MTEQANEVQQRLKFIDRTICHAAQACHLDTSIPEELKDFVHRLGLQANHAILALSCHDDATMRNSVDALTRISQEANRAISQDINYDLKCAVILTQIELSALKYHLTGSAATQQWRA